MDMKLKRLSAATGLLALALFTSACTHTHTVVHHTYVVHHHTVVHHTVVHHTVVHRH